VESVYVEGDGLAVGVLRIGGQRERDWGMVGGMERSPRKGSIHIVVAAGPAGPSIGVGSAVPAADNTDQWQDTRIAAGQCNLRRYIGSLRTAWGIKGTVEEMGWGRGKGGRRAGEKDGQIEGVE